MVIRPLTLAPPSQAAVLEQSLAFKQLSSFLVSSGSVSASTSSRTAVKTRELAQLHGVSLLSENQQLISLRSPVPC